MLTPIASLAQVLADWAWAGHREQSETNPKALEIAERAREAERLLQDCLAARLRSANPGDTGRTEDVRSRLGGALLTVAVTDPTLTSEARTAKFIEAEKQLLEGNEALQRITQSGRSPYQRNALRRLVRLYKAWGKADQAAGWQQKLADFDKVEATPETNAVPPDQQQCRSKARPGLVPGPLPPESFILLCMDDKAGTGALLRVWRLCLRHAASPTLSPIFCPAPPSIHLSDSTFERFNTHRKPS